MILFLQEAWGLYVKKREERRHEAQKRKLAQLFNSRYTYKVEYVPNLPALPGTGFFGLTPNGGYAWMCPLCNKIHHPKSNSVFSGLQYPRCCDYPEGERLSYIKGWTW